MRCIRGNYTLDRRQQLIKQLHQHQESRVYLVFAVVVVAVIVVVSLLPALPSRSMDQWASPGGCGWRTPSTITSTTRNISSCKKNRQVFMLLLLKNWTSFGILGVFRESFKDPGKNKSLVATLVPSHLCQTLQKASFSPEQKTKSSSTICSSSSV